jgi:hypothetical protein
LSHPKSPGDQNFFHPNNLFQQYYKMDKSKQEENNPFSFFKYDKSLDEEDDLDLHEDDQSSVVITKPKETITITTDKKTDEKSKDNPYSIFAYLENSPAKSNPPSTTTKKSKNINSDDDNLSDDFSDEEGDAVPSVTVKSNPSPKSDQISLPSVVVKPDSTTILDNHDMDEDLDLDDEDIDYKAENAALKQRINKMSDVYFTVKARAEEAEKKNKECKQKLDGALAQLQKYQEKEKKEEKELETALKLIEATLATTKARAEQAEADKIKLVAQVQQLTEQLNNVNIQRQRVAEEMDWKTIKEKSKSASDIVKKTTSTARDNLKNLIQGLKSIDELAEILNTMDKVSEVYSSNQTKNSE